MIDTSLVDVAEAVRAASLGHAAEVEQDLLCRLALLDGRNGSLNQQGRAFEDAYWIESDEATAERLLTQALLRLPATQALMQGLHGRGPVAFRGAHHLMARHGLADPDDPTRLRAFLSMLNRAGLVAYSNKLQTLRILAPLPEGAAAQVRVIEPERPYSNVVALRQILRGCEGYIWWAEPHLGRKALEPLALEADVARITNIRLLSGEKAVDKTARTDFKRFHAEILNRGIASEWRIIRQADMDWHDRFIMGRRQAWNVPPVNTLHKGDYSEASRTATRPPFERWWALGTPLAS